MFAKVSMDGKNGGGKSFTTAMLAVALSREYADGGPVLMFDSEGRGELLKALIYDVEKVPVTIVRGTSLVSVLETLRRCRAEKFSVFLADQLTTPWLEGLKAFAFENGDLPFNRRAQLMNQWDEMVRLFKGPFHSIACGRLGYHWENVEDPETGDIKLLQGDSKFNAGGGQNFGYECELELEIRRKKNLVGGLFRRQTAVQHVCDVVKDVTTMLSGQQFTFDAIKGGYKRGGYKPLFEALRPHLDFLQKMGAGFDPKDERQSSRELIVGGKTPWARDNAERKALLEEISDTLDFCFPGGTGKSALANAFKKLTLEYLNSSSSWSRLEEDCPTEELGKYKLILLAMRHRIEKGGQIPNTQREVMTLLDLSTDDVFGGPAKNMTLLEAMGLRSIQQVKGPKANGKAQPVVSELERDLEAAGD